jgi:hypothetical protein
MTSSAFALVSPLNDLDVYVQDYAIFYLTREEKAGTTFDQVLAEAKKYTKVGGFFP